jgi:hypothetical protein
VFLIENTSFLTKKCVIYYKNASFTLKMRHLLYKNASFPNLFKNESCVMSHKKKKKKKLRHIPSKNIISHQKTSFPTKKTSFPIKNMIFLSKNAILPPKNAYFTTKSQVLGARDEVVPASVQHPVVIDGVTVCPGDWVVGDATGVAFVPQNRVGGGFT